MKWYHWIVIIAFIALLAVIGFQCKKQSDQNARIAELADSLQSREGLIKVDSNTYIRKGMALAQGELIAMAEKNGDLAQEIEYLKQRNKELTGIIKIKTEFRIDTIYGPADTVYRINGVEHGEKTFKTEWYNFGVSWSCVPYQASLYHVKIWDELSILPFKDSEGNDEGVMVSNKNPYVEIGSALYYFEKRDPNPDRFRLGLGLGSNNAADLTGHLSANYGPIGLWGTLNFNSGVIKDRKITSDDWRVGAEYFILR